MTKIILVRHGQTVFNAEGRVQGWRDSALTPKGETQARCYGRCIKSLIDGDAAAWRVVSSPLGRCVQTTELLCAEAGLDPAAVSYDPRLREIDTGSLSGRLKTELPPELVGGTGLDHWVFKTPDGESHADISARLGGWLADLAPGDGVIAVSHGIAGKVLRGLYAGLDPAEALRGDSPQDAVFVLEEGAIRRVACG